MSWFSRLRNHLRSNRVSSDIQREMRFHLDERADDLVASGLTREAAQREARRKFGSLAYQSENTRASDLFTWLDVLLGDLRYAVRSLRAAPAFTLVAILSLALGIGANTAIFSILNAVMLKSLPVMHPEALVALERNDSRTFTNPLWEAIRDRQDVFNGIFAVGPMTFNLTAGGEARRAPANWVSGGYFATLGVQPAAGRLIAADDDRRGCPGVAVISHAFWQSEYGGKTGIVGQTISLDGHPFQILGVAAPGFTGLDVGRQVNVFVPICTEAILRGTATRLDNPSHWFLQIVGRVKPGVTQAQVTARFQTLAPAIIQATLPSDWSVSSTEHYKRSTFTVTPAAKGFSDLRTTYRKALYVLMAIVGLVLIIACANVANLLLARAATRQREIAVRLALGSGRGRLIRQLVTESLLLSGLGAVAGVALAMWSSRALVAMLSRTGRAVSLDLSVDPIVLAFLIAVSVGSALLFGLVPAWRASRVDPQAAMKAQGRGVAEGHSRVNVGKTLVALQIALSLVLVVGAGLLLGSWRRLATLDPGFHRDHVLLVNVDIRTAAVPNEQRAALFAQMIDRLRALPGVRAASASEVTPLGNSQWNNFIRTEGFTPKSEGDAVTWMNAVDDGYFTTLGIPIRAGRDFGRAELEKSSNVAIVNEAMARKYFGTTAAVGRRFQVQRGKGWGPQFNVVGVVGDTKYVSLRDSAPSIVYFPRSHETSEQTEADFELLADGSPTLLVPAVKSAMAELSPRATLEFVTLERQVAESMMLSRTIAVLSAFFGGLALLLATIGLYGIMSYSVARRRNEIGVRIALGAVQARVVRMVLGDVGRIVIVGVLLGVGLSVAATRLVTSFLYGIKPNDPLTLGAAALVLVVVGLVAAAVPAFRAARLDPVAALREE